MSSFSSHFMDALAAQPSLEISPAVPVLPRRVRRELECIDESYLEDKSW